MDKNKAHKQALEKIGKIPCFECKILYSCRGLHSCIKAENYLELYNCFIKKKLNDKNKIEKIIDKIFKKKKIKFKEIKIPYLFLTLNGYDTI